jgi:trimethylamine--corrinoid protein Co-methyltransferase
MKDFLNFIRLSQSFDAIYLLAPYVEPRDVHVNVRHLESTLARLTPAHKPPGVICRGRQQIRDCFEMIRLAHGLDEGEFSRSACAYTYGCSAGGLQAMSEAQKFPWDLDGIIAGAPSMKWTETAFMQECLAVGDR